MAYVLDYKARIQSLGEVFVEDMGGLLTPEDIAIYTADDFNNCSQYQGRTLAMIGPSSQVIAAITETRCECGQLIAKVRGLTLELKCKRCKRIVVIPFHAIEGWTAASSAKALRVR